MTRSYNLLSLTFACWVAFFGVAFFGMAPVVVAETSPGSKSTDPTVAGSKAAGSRAIGHAKVGPTIAAPTNMAKPASSSDTDQRDEVDDDDAGDLMRQWIYRMTRVRTPSSFERNHAEVRSAFRDVVRDPRRSTVRIVCDQNPSTIGVIVDTNGLVLTKSSELSGHIQCVMPDRRRFDAEILATDPDTDLALLKVKARDLPAIAWNTSIPAVGSWLATPGLEDDPISIGVVSVAPRAIPAPTPMLGVVLGTVTEGAQIQRVVPGSSAEKAGLKPEDVIKNMNGTPIKNHESVIERVRQLQPGNEVKLIVARSGQSLQLTAVLGDSISLLQGERAVFQNNLGGPLSRRRTGFPSVLQHDSVLRPNQCGGAIVDLDGKAVGINIARAGRVESYALPAKLVVEVVERLKVQGEAVAARKPVSDTNPTSLIQM